MGYGATRSLERVAAAMGALEAAPIVFEAARDIPQGGVLLALPALMAVGLLRHSAELYTLPKGFYGLSSVLVLLALMALARIGSIEQLRYAAAGEWGNLLGLDRIPEVRTLREKLKRLCTELGRAARWNAALAKEWISQQETEQSSGLAFYIDGHVRVYHGELTKLPRHYVPRERFYLRATTDYWVNALDGQPFCYVNQAVDHGLVQAIRGDILPWLEANVPLSAEHRERMAADPRVPRFTVIFDREGYSPELFLELQKERIAALTYHRYPDGEDWRAEEFQEQAVKLVSGETVRMKLAERGTCVGKRPGLWVREVRKLAADGHRVSIVSTNFTGDAASQAVAPMARWSQENYFKYAREHFGLVLPRSIYSVNTSHLKHRDPGDSRRPSLHACRGIFPRDPAQCEHRNRHLPHRLPQALDAQRRPITRFRDHRKNRTEHRKVRAFRFGAAQLLQCVRGHADQKLRRHDRAQNSRRHRISAQMDPVRARRQRNIGARIHQYARTVRVGQRQYPAHQRAQIARAQVLLAHLNPFHAVRERALDKPQQRFRAAGGMPVRDVIAQHHAGP